MEFGKTLYQFALENLNNQHDGDEVFESVCHELVKFSLPDYRFTKPSGGNGPRDGGRDGFDVNKKCRMACSIRETYERKIDEEIKKCGSEKELFFFTNQKIPETKKIALEKKYKPIVDLSIFSWADLSASIEIIPRSIDFRETRAKIDDLLGVQKLTFVNDCKNFDIKSQNVECEGNIYKSKIIVKQQEDSSYRSFCGINPLISYFDFIFHNKRPFSKVPNFYLKGVFGIGKTTSAKLLYNSFLAETEKEWAKSFFPLYYSLKNFPEQQIKIPSTDNNFICFLDGIDEISDEKQLKLLRTISNYINSNNVRFILSGRDAGFNSDTESYFNKESYVVKMVPYIDPSDTELIQLLAKLKNSPLKRMAPIPVFRKFFSNNDEIKNLTPKKIYDKVVLDPLKKDCQKFFQSIDEVDFNVRETFYEIIVDKFSTFCYEIFRNEMSSFSQTYLKKYFSGKEFDYIQKSTLLDFQSSDSISFHNYFYYEYFVARYFVDRFDLIKTHLIKNGRVNPKNLNIIQIILETSKNQILLCKQMTEHMAEITGFSLMLKIKHSLIDDVRYDLYKRIYEYFCVKGRFIYYISFNNRRNQFSDIDSLSDELYELLPDQCKTDAMTFLFENTLKCVENVNAENIIRFANAVILLGVWKCKIWNDKEQKRLKKESTTIISFFLNNKEKLKILDGLLSESIALSWYKTYGWTLGWEKYNWDDFFKNLFPNTQGFGTFANDEEYHFQLELFNYFSNDDYIKLLAKPLCIEIMKKLCDDIAIADYVPNEIDDNYKPSYVHIDSEIYTFHEILKKGIFLSADDVVDVIQGLIDAHVDFHSSNYEFRELKKELSKIWLSQINSLSIDKVNDIYKIIACAMNESEDLSFYEIEDGLKILPDEIKYSLLECILQKLDDLNWKYDWYFYGLITLLLDTTSESVKEKLEQVHRKISEDSYNSLVLKIYKTVEENRPLYTIIKSIYEEKYAKDIQEENIRQKCLLELRKKHVATEINEANLIVNSSLILQEIDSVEKLFNDEYTKDEKELFSFFDLEYDQIEHNLRYDLNKKKKLTNVFSNFVIKFLRLMPCNNSSEAFELARNFVKNWFSDEKKYWRFFYDYYVCQYSNEDVEKFLAKNTILQQKILDSMKIEICELQDELNVQQVISLKGCAWVIPFVKYLHILLNDKLPSYIKKEKLLSLIAFPSIFVHSNTYNDFGTYESVFSWLQTVAGFSTERLVEKSIEFYPLVQRDDTKAQILSYLIKHIDLKEDIIFEIIYKETEKVLRKDYSNNEYDAVNHGPLAHFWEKADAKYLRKIFEIVPFERYDLRRENPCLREITDYSLKYMTLDEKIRLMKNLEKIHNDGVRELLLRLGSKKEIIKKIKGYLKGDKVEYSFSYRPVITFGFIKKDLRILWAYWKLFKYSMEYASERRSVLYSIAKKGITEHLGPKTFFLLKLCMHSMLRKRIEAGLHVDSFYDFIDEMEQIIYSR